MMNRRKSSVSVMCAIAIGGAAAVALGLTGCSGEEERPVVQERAAPPPPPPPAPPPVRSVEELKAELRIDDRVIMSEDAAPGTTEERRAVLSFFDAFARGDDRALGRMLSDLDRRQLDRMVESGQWASATTAIEEIMIYQTGDSPGGKAALALLLVDGSDQAQLWYYTGSGDDFTFEAAPTPPNMARRLSGTDWIAAWHRILEEEMELAMRPDEEIERPQRVLDEEESDRGTAAPGGPTAPGAPTVTPRPPGGPTGPRPPRRIPRDAPPG